MRCTGDGAAAFEGSGPGVATGDLKRLVLSGWVYGQGYQCIATANNTLGEGAGSSPPYSWTSPPNAPTITKVAAGAGDELFVDIQNPALNGNQGEQAGQQVEGHCSVGPRQRG